MQAESRLSFRTQVRESDIAAVRAIVESTGFFHPPEVEVAVELVAERLSRGEASGYHFIFAESDGRVIGYTCFGPIACTLASYDLFWIAVHADLRGRGIGRGLMAETEARIAARGGARVYIETSSRPQYQPTRDFYLRCGYREEAVLSDFYAPGDGKVICMKCVAPAT